MQQPYQPCTLHKHAHMHVCALHVPQPHRHRQEVHMLPLQGGPSQGTCQTALPDVLRPTHPVPRHWDTPCAGLLTGGSRSNGPSILARLSELARAQAAMQQHHAGLEDAEQRLKGLAAAAKNYKQ
jgi:hypothetical protein